MANIDAFNTDEILGSTKGSSFEITFTGAALQDLKKLKPSLNVPDEKSVVNFAIALLIKAQKENSSIAILDSAGNITYSLDL